MHRLLNDSLDDFLRPLRVDPVLLAELARQLQQTYAKLAYESHEQFLSTPVKESLLRPRELKGGKYLAVDIGGTNLRVGFVQLTDHHPENASSLSENDAQSDNGLAPPMVHYQKSWPIGEKLKNENAEDLFAWIGNCVAEVVEENLASSLPLLDGELPMGVTFSFPMIQHSLAEAILMPMGKGFAITSNLDLNKQLITGYITAVSTRSQKLPGIKIVAITNDAVATLVAFVHQIEAVSSTKAAMGLIVGTGTNATIPMKLSSLHPDKRLSGLPLDEKIVVNTEWTINGAVGPLRELNLISSWDNILDSESAAPGFQPFEYMTSGRYLGELVRITVVDYFTKHLNIDVDLLPRKLVTRNALTTTFLGKLKYRPGFLQQLELEVPPLDIEGSFQWTFPTAEAVCRIVKAIQVRAAGLCAAAVIGLLACAEILDAGADEKDSAQPLEARVRELTVGYTGGCIVNFQNYLRDCQRFLDEIMEIFMSREERPKVLLKACHDGGIIGAGVLAGVVGGT